MPTGRRRTSWLIYKHGRGFELGTTENKSSQRSGRDLNTGPPNCKSSALTARPRCPHRIKYTSRQTSTLIYKHGREVELGTTENKSSQRSGRALNTGPPNCKSSALTARPRCPHRIKYTSRQTSTLIYKHGREVELGTTENKSSQRSGRDLNTGPPDSKSSAVTVRLRCPHR